MRLGPTLLLAACAGCGDAELAIELELPAAYREHVALVSLAVLEPPAREPFDCDALAFGELAPELLRATQSSEVSSASPGALDLTVSRNRAKLLWARGLDRAGQLVVSGCVAVGALDDNRSVTIRAEPASVLVPRGDGIGELGDPLPETIGVQLSDVLGRPLAGAELRWTIAGAGGPEQRWNGRALADADGTVVATLDASPRPGPALMIAQSRWARTPPFELGGMTPLAALLEETLNSRLTAIEVGRIGPGGEVGLAAIATVSGAASLVAIHWDGLAFAASPAHDTGLGAATALLRRGGSDELLTHTGSEWVSVLPGTTPVRTPAPVLGDAVVGLYELEPCGSPTRELLVEDGAGRFFCLDAAGSQATPCGFATLGIDRLRVSAAGCVVGADGGLRRTFVARTEDPWVQYVIADVGPWGLGGWAAHAAGPVVQGGRLYGVLRDATGVRLTEHELAGFDGTALRLETVAASSLPSQAMATVLADIDGDGRDDTVALLPESEPSAGAALAVRLWVGLGDNLRGRRIVGVSEASAPMQRATLRAADFDADGRTDIVLAELPEDAAATASLLLVLTAR